MRMRPHNPGSRRRGFTLVEAIAAMTIISALGSVTSALIYTAISSYRSSYTVAQLHEEISTALDRVSRRLRDVELNAAAPAGTIAPNISNVSASSISFSGSSSLTLSSGSISFVDAGAPAVTLLSNVSSFSVQCYDESNAAMGATLSAAACYPIRRIAVQITCQRDGVTETVRTRVFVRSTMQGGSP
jgi:prepilin-type N-terminal cleavage/methylation domain-containing protein